MVDEDSDPRHFILSSVSIAGAAATSLLFWPDFVDYQGCVFLRFAFDRAAVERWFGELGGDGRAVESMVNHVHLWDVFAADSPDEYDLVAELAPRLGRMWEAALAAAFPARRFVLVVGDGSADYGPTVSFYSA